MKRKLLLLFIPLVLAFMAIGFMIQDLKHPVAVQWHTCRLVGRGLVLADFKQHARMLYQYSGHPQDDIGLDCGPWGLVLINEVVPLPLKEDQIVQVKAIRYHYLPPRYKLSVSVVNPQDAALTHPPKQNTFKLPPLNIKGGFR